MMRRSLLVLLMLMTIPAVANADEVSIADLVADSPAFDGAIVGEIVIEGELIGDFQRRGSFVWVQVNGDAYIADPILAGGASAGGNIGVGARIPTGDFDALGVQTPGGYRVRGPIVQMSGTWHHHDDARGGESYFAAESITLVSPELELEEDVHWGLLGAGIALLIVSGITPRIRSWRRLRVGRRSLIDRKGALDV